MVAQALCEERTMDVEQRYQPVEHYSRRNSGEDNYDALQQR